MARTLKTSTNRLNKAMNDFHNFVGETIGTSFIPGHYYKGAYDEVIKVVSKSPSGKTVYITTHSDADDAFLQTKRVKTDADGNDYICYKNSHYVIGTWHKADREDFLAYIQKNIGKPVAVI